MPATYTMTLTGTDELAASVAAASDRLLNLESANRATAELISEAAAARAPRRSGRLGGSLRGVVGFGGAGRPGFASVYSDLIYAGPIHFGWPGHNIAANPFLARAGVYTQDRWAKLYADEIAAVLDTVKGV